MARIRAAWSERDWEGMTAGVSDRMLDEFALVGTPDEVRDQYTQRRPGLFERTLLWPPALARPDAARAVISVFGNRPGRRGQRVH